MRDEKRFLHEVAAPLAQERGLSEGRPTPIVFGDLPVLGCRLPGREAELGHH